jgi:hypothetical protein
MVIECHATGRLHDNFGGSKSDAGGQLNAADTCYSRYGR